MTRRAKATVGEPLERGAAERPGERSPKRGASNLMPALIAVAALACGGRAQTAGGRCESTYAHVAKTPGFADSIGGATYGAGMHLVFGAACHDFTKDDLACLDKAATIDAVKACAHAARVVGAAARQARTEGIVIGRANLARIAEGARAYFADAKRLPDAAPRTPNTSCCARKGGRCQPNATQWTSATWAALKFAVDEPDDFTYELTTAGTGDGATFDARAEGNPGCAGHAQIWEVSGRVAGTELVIDPPRQISGAPPDPKSLPPLPPRTFGRTEEDDAIDELSAFADRLCACPDSACLERTERSMQDLGRKYPNFHPTPEAEKRIEKIAARMGQCMSRIMNPQPPPPR